jgi:hypothetical protein
MSEITIDIVNEIKIGRVFYYNYYTVHRIKNLYQFLNVLQVSPLEETCQLEALGGTLYNIQERELQHPKKYGISIENLRFILHLCMKHVHVHYFVVCILTITTNFLWFHDEDNTSFISSEIYPFLAFLTIYHEENKNTGIYWSVDIFMIWTNVFKKSDVACTTFCNNSKLVHALLEISKCKSRGDIIPSFHDYDEDETEECILVREELTGIPGYNNDMYIFSFIYTLVKENIHIQYAIAQHWPFILDNDGQLLNYYIFLNILEQIQEEENTPKSANKH